MRIRALIRAPARLSPILRARFLAAPAQPTKSRESRARRCRAVVEQAEVSRSVSRAACRCPTCPARRAAVQRSSRACCRPRRCCSNHPAPAPGLARAIRTHAARLRGRRPPAGRTLRPAPVLRQPGQRRTGAWSRDRCWRADTGLDAGRRRGGQGRGARAARCAHAQRRACRV